MLVRLVAPRPEQVYPDTYWRRPLAGRGGPRNHGTVRTRCRTRWAFQSAHCRSEGVTEKLTVRTADARARRRGDRV